MSEDEKVKIEVIPGGSFKVHGSVTLLLPDGTSVETKKVSFLCRCGKSEEKPYCDGSHKGCNFEGMHKSEL